MYTLATIFIFLVIGLSIYFQLTKNKKFKINPKNKDLVKIFTKTNPSLLYPILFLSIHFSTDQFNGFGKTMFNGHINLTFVHGFENSSI